MLRMNTLAVAVASSTLLASAAGAAVIFDQHFSSSNVLSDYIGSGANQVNAASTSGTGVSVSVANSSLNLSRNTGNAGAITRNTDFYSSVPDQMLIQLDLGFTPRPTATTWGAATSAAVFYVGNNFTTANTGPANSDSYARLAFNINSTSGSWTVRDIQNSTNGSSNYTGLQSITIALNNTGSSLNYTPPGSQSATASVANDRMDVYVGTSLVFNDVTITTASQTLNDFKFLFNAGSAVFSLDRIVITDVVPEPTTLGLLAGVGLLAARRRR